MIRVPTRVAFVPAIELRNKIFFLVFPFLVLSGTIILLFSRTISRPLVQLSRAAQEIGEGHLDVRVNIRSRDEIGQLAKEFERMVLNLQKTTTSITNLEREISERRRVENALQQERDFDQSLIETAQVIILVLDIEGRIVLFNPFLEDISGYRLLDVKGKNWFSLFISLEDRDVVRSVFQEVLKTPGTVQAENQIVTREGRRREISWNSKTMKDVKGKTIGLLSIGQDVTERKKAEEFIRKMAFHDSLTGLPNRKLFQERLTQELARARRKMETVAIMFLDLDGFKTINDTYGHEIGDKVLCEVARRLEQVKRESDIACRLGGDEFTLLLTGMNSPEDALGIARRLLDTIRNPVEIGGHTFFISVSIGISFCPANGTDPETLVKRADEAMYLAKTRGKDQFQVSSEEGTLP
ncbi:MAG: diguanylate cyclase [Atribacterota bacterium]